jgi:hypothetical protein
MHNIQLKSICKICNKICKKYAKYASNMQVLMILPYIALACNIQNMQKNMHDMQSIQTSFSICRICTAHFADGDRMTRFMINFGCHDARPGPLSQWTRSTVTESESHGPITSHTGSFNVKVLSLTWTASTAHLGTRDSGSRGMSNLKAGPGSRSRLVTGSNVKVISALSTFLSSSFIALGSGL